MIRCTPFDGSPSFDVPDQQRDARGFALAEIAATAGGCCGVSRNGAPVFCRIESWRERAAWLEADLQTAIAACSRYHDEIVAAHATVVRAYEILETGLPALPLVTGPIEIALNLRSALARVDEFEAQRAASFALSRADVELVRHGASLIRKCSGGEDLLARLDAFLAVTPKEALDAR